MKDIKWYRDESKVKQYFYGVFEGGGAKGVAYAGALQAMTKQKAWFKAVAGASAGAITAALIASGIKPEDIERKTIQALQIINADRSLSSGLKRLEMMGGYYSPENLRDWLNSTIRELIGEEKAKNEIVTFQELFDKTQIDLFIVAANISQRNQIIFNHQITPNCSVADAVIASSSIPFAFPSQLLKTITKTGENDSKKIVDTIVDGGVWANFPIYVFSDIDFRQCYELADEKIKPLEIIGFLLDSKMDRKPANGEFIDFVPIDEVISDQKNYQFREFLSPDNEEAESTTNDQENANANQGLSTSLLRILGFFAGIASFTGQLAKLEQTRRRVEDWEFLEHFLTLVDGILGTLHRWWVLLIVLVFCILGAVQTFLFGIEQIKKMLKVALSWFNVNSPETIILGNHLINILSIFPGILILLLVFGIFIFLSVNRILLRAVRQNLHGLTLTYIAGTGAPSWIERKDNIIVLDIPPDVTTLSFDLPEKRIREITAKAEKKTTKELSRIMNKRQSDNISTVFKQQATKH